MSLTIAGAENLVNAGTLRDGMSFRGVTPEANPGISAPDQPASGGNFLSQLKDAIRDVDSIQKQADSAAVDLATGHSTNIHEAMIQMEKADIALKSLVAVRNKVLEAYREVMRIQV